MSEPKKNCQACKHSYMEPDDDLTCGHTGAGSFGLYVKNREKFTKVHSALIEETQ